MARCCGGATCACKITVDGNIEVSGTGTSQDPFLLAVNNQLNVTDTSVFNFTLSGTGHESDPWELTLAFAATAKLDDIPDVNAPAPTNAQVLGWDSATSKWTARAPTTAASGSVTHDTSLAGDGSGGSPLAVSPNPARGLSTTASGLGLLDSFMNMLVRRFTNTGARSAADPAPVLNSLAMLDTAPGRITYWDGVAWKPLDTGQAFTSGAAFGELSGAWADGMDTIRSVKTISFVTDAAGKFTIYDSAALSGRAGVLTCQVQETGTVPYKALVNMESGQVVGTAYRADDGTPYVSQSLTATVFAVLY